MKVFPSETGIKRENTVHNVSKILHMDGVFMKTKRHIVILLLALSAALTATAFVLLQRQQADLAEKLIRLHVVANSDSEADQALKLRVRDAVLAVTEPLMAKAADPKAALAENLPAIQSAAETCLRENGASDSVRVTLGREEFPTRIYDSFSLPAGIYTALRVTIGAGEGHNWWCVVFPSICFRATAADLESAAVSAGFTDQEVKLITEANEAYVLKFKTLELLQKLQAWLLGQS